MTIEEQDKIDIAINKINKLPPRELGGIYKDEVFYPKEMERQKKFLTDLIISPPSFIFDKKTLGINYPLIFKVIDNECGFGKSTVALYGIIKYFNNYETRDNKVIWVTERIEDCEENAKKLNELTEIEDFAIAITGETTRALREEYVRKYKVIFITHERYRRLARYYNEDERNSFKEGKQLLIIDEKINMQKTISFCKTKHNELIDEIKKLVGKKASNKAINIYHKIVNPLLKYLNRTTKKDIFKKGIIMSFKSDLQQVENYIEQLKAIIKANANDDNIYEDFEDKDYQTIYEKIEDLREFFVGRCIVDSITYAKLSEVCLQVPNYSMQMWGLQNNIVLDATATIDLTYQYRDDLFQILHQKNVFNHKYWKIHCLDINCTTYGRTRLYTNFYDEVNKIITEYGEDNFFVMANMYDDEEPLYKGSTERRKKHIFFGTVGHIGNVNGRNDFIDKTNYINTDYLYENDRSYILKYLYYNPNIEIENWRSINGKLIDERLEEFKVYEVARNLYQSIKRINRDMKHISNIFLLSHREEITKLALSLMEGADISINKGIEKRFTKVEREKKTKEKKKIKEFKDLCNIILKNKFPVTFEKLLEDDEFRQYKELAQEGNFAKCLFYKTLEMSNKSFGNNVLYDKDKIVKKFLEQKGIKNTRGKYLIFPNFSIKK